MIKISLICVGKLKERYWKEAVAEYEKRLSSHCSLRIMEAKDERTPDNASFLQTQEILSREARRLEKLLAPRAYTCALAVDGAPYDSLSLAAHLRTLELRGESHLQFLIGGSLGLHESILERADERVSFSALTFPHQLMRVILLEQLYRSFRINAGEPYHK